MLIDAWIRKCLRKKSYASKAEALKMAEYQMMSQAKRVSLRVYHCAQCKKYHLTSKR